MDKRAELLQRALDLFSSEGYSSTGIQRIVDAAGVKKPTLYHYFGSKEGLLQTLFEEGFKPFVAGLREDAVYQGDLVLTLEKIIARYFRFVEEQPQVFRLISSLAFGPRENEAVRSALALLQEPHTILEQLFVAAVPDHGNLRGKQRLLALTLHGMITVYCMLHLQTGEPLDGVRLQEIRRQFMHGIFS